MADGQQPPEQALMPQSPAQQQQQQQDWLKLSSFHAASFFAEEERRRGLQGEQLRAAAEALLPSSSEEESESSESKAEAVAGTGAEGREAAAQRREAEQVRGRRESKEPDRRERTKRRKKDRDKDRGKQRRHRSRSRSRERGSKRRKQALPDDLQQAVEAERRKGPEARASQVRGWVRSEKALEKEPYYFDTRGDPANLAFGGLYRMDVAIYRRHDPSRFASLLGAPSRRGMPGVRTLVTTEADGHRMQKAANRYFSAPVARRERSTRLQRWRRPPPPPGSSSWGRVPARMPPGSYVPLDPSKDGQQPKLAGEEAPTTYYQVYVPQAQRQQQEQQQQEEEAAARAQAAVQAAAAVPAQQLEAESWEEAVLRRTRELNAATRDRPQDLQLWLQFAAFQDEVARSGPLRRGAQRAAAEKKVAILERALTFHPDSDRLLLALLDAARPLCDETEMDRRWRRVLARYPGSAALWRAYIARRASQWSGFSARELPQLHCQAVTALARERQRSAATGTASFAALATLECEVVQLALGGAQAALAAGATELGVAMLQVLLEFHFFAPAGWPLEALLVMFEDFWSSDAALIGEEGGAGWASWLAGEPQQRPAAVAAAAKRRAAQEAAEQAAREREQQEAARATQQQARGSAAAQEAAAEAGAWSGWEELGPAIRERFGHSLQFLDDLGPAGQSREADAVGGGDADGKQEQEDAVEAAGRADIAGEHSEAEAEVVEGGRESSGEEEEDEEAGEGQEQEEEEEAEEEAESDEALLEKLGLQLDAALEAAGSELPPPVLAAWLATEQQREAAAWEPRRVAAGSSAADASEGEEEEAGPGAGGDVEAAAAAAVGGAQGRRKVGWPDVRALLVPLETEAAKQQLLMGVLLLLGAPLPASSCSPSSPAAGSDELWRAAAWSGASSPDSSSSSSSPSQLPPWAVQLLSSGSWGWLHQHSSRSEEAPQLHCALRQQPWYREHPSRQQMLLQLLLALARGPCRQQPAVAAALLAVAAEVEASPAGEEAAPAAVGADSAAKPPQQQQRDWKKARALAKELLAEQRDNLVFWQAYAELERQAGASKAARKVLDTWLATAAATAAAAAAASAAQLVLSAVALELGMAGPRSSSSLLGAAAAASEAAAAAALRLLAWLGSRAGVPHKAAAGGSAALRPEEVVAARRGYQDVLLSLLQQQQRPQPGTAEGGAGSSTSCSGALGAGEAALVQAAAAFEVLAGRLQLGSLSAGVKAGLKIYEQVLTALLQQQQQQGTTARPSSGSSPTSSSGSSSGVYLEQLCSQWCSLAVDASRAGLPAVSPAAARAVLMRGLAAFPASPSLLLLLVAHELAGHTINQLRRALLGFVKEHSSPPAWLALLSVEVLTHAPRSAVRSVLERAVSSDGGRASPLLWRLYLRWEAACGRGEAVHRVFLRAIAACPGSKAVWADGLALLNGVAPAKELTEFLEVMKDKELTLRTDAFEVLLEQLGGGGNGGAEGGTVGGKAE